MTAEMFTRDELLAGLPARRARTLLFLIESKSAHLAARSRQAMEPFLTEEAAAKRDLAFLEAFSLGKQPPQRPSIQDIEHYAPDWAALVPNEPRLRAALAHALGQKYRFRAASVPKIRRALSLDDEAVEQAYDRLYHQPLHTIYAARYAPGEQVRWSLAGLSGRLESLSPFWTSFSLTLTETVGAGVLALPIAIAGVGPLGGLIVLIVLGIVNMLTLASMAESVSRSGTIRYGNAFLGAMVSDYLGNIGSIAFTLGAASLTFIMLLAYYIGFSSTLASASGIPSQLWAVLFFLVGLYFLFRESIDATVASALVVGGINIVLILGLALLAFIHVRTDYLFYIDGPFVNGRPFDPGILELIFGTILSAYIGHLSVGNCAKVVLRRDPTAHSLIWGGVAAQVAALILYSIWVVAVNGAISPQVLAAQAGTALTPLAAQIGPAVNVLGVVYVVLAMGMASIHSSLGLFYMVSERLPSRLPTVLLMPQGHGTLLLRPRGAATDVVRFGLTYLGTDRRCTQFRLNVQIGSATHRFGLSFAQSWDIAELSAALECLNVPPAPLSLEILKIHPEGVHVRVDTPMQVSYEGEWETTGVGLLDILQMPDDKRQLVNWILRRQSVNVAQTAAHLRQDETSAQRMLDELVEQGQLQRTWQAAQAMYRVRLAQRKGRQLPAEIWRALEGDAHDGSTSKPAGAHPLDAVTARAKDAVASDRGRFLISILPIVVTFLACEWLFFSQNDSFASLVGFIGVLAGSLFAGIFPVLLLYSSRKKGEFVPGVVYRVLGSPPVIAIVYLIFLGSIFVHGLFIWENPLQRGIALLTGVLIVLITAIMLRRGAFSPRTVVQVRREPQAKQAQLNVIQDGQEFPVEFAVGYHDRTARGTAAQTAIPDFDQAHQLDLALPAGKARQLKVWAYDLEPEGEAIGMAAELEVRQGGRMSSYDLLLSDGQAVVPIEDRPYDLTVKFAQETGNPPEAGSGG